MSRTNAPITESQSKDSLTKLTYGVFFLFLTTAAYFMICVRYDAHLIETKRFSSLRTIDEYSDLRDSLFYLMQLLIVVVLFFRPLRQILGPLPDENTSGGGLLVPRNMQWGALGGMIGLLVTVPIFLREKSSQLGSFLANHLYGADGLLLLVVLIFLLPIVVEGFFRGIVLRRLLDKLSAPSAVILATVLFTLYWPFFGFFAGAIVGMVTGIVFYRTKSVPACITANSTFTFGAIVLLVWRAVQSTR